MSSKCCSGIDFLYDIDYKALASSIPPEHVSHIAASNLRVADEGAGSSLVTVASGGAPPAARVLVLNNAGGGSGGPPLGWLPIADWKQNSWKGPFAQRTRAALEAVGLQNLRIVRDCLNSLANSHD